MRPGGALWLVVLVGAGCVAPLPHATVDDETRARAQWPAATVASLEAGRRLFAFRCSACHGLELPASHPVEKWPSILDEMQQEAKLSADERAAIEQFVLTIASRPAAAVAPGPTPAGGP